MNETAVKQEIATVATQPLAPVVPISENTAIVAMIERAARDPAVNIDKLERLIAMRDHMAAVEKEQAFNDAMSRAQADMGRVATDAENDQTHSKYASYAALDRAIRPIYTACGFGLSFNTETGAPENYIRIVCHVTGHGHTRKYQIDMPADGKGAKGGDVMTRTHATGSAATYGQRYLLKLIFNIAVGTDDDGNAASNREFISEEQTAALKKLIEDTGGDVTRFCAFAKVEKLENIYASRYDAAVAAVKRAGEDRKKAKTEKVAP